jgi:hypothetical protein
LDANNEMFVLTMTQDLCANFQTHLGLSFWGLLSFDQTIIVKSFSMKKQHLCLEEGIQSLLRPIVATLNISMGSWHGWVDRNMAKKNLGPKSILQAL